MCSPEEDSPRNAAGVLALEEQRLGFAVLEAEDLAITADVEFTLSSKETSKVSFYPLLESSMVCS